jgi:hypothetical protein
LPLAVPLAIGNFWQAEVAAPEIWADAFWVGLTWEMPPLTIENKSAVIKDRAMARFMRKFEVLDGRDVSETSFNCRLNDD